MKTIESKFLNIIVLASNLFCQALASKTVQSLYYNAHSFVCAPNFELCYSLPLASLANFQAFWLMEIHQRHIEQ